MSETLSSSLDHDFLSESLNLTSELLTDIIYDCSDLGSHSPEREFLWNTKITNLSNDVSQFVEISTLVAKNVIARTKRPLHRLKESHIQLLFIMKSIKEAQEKQDYIALEELIKHELKDNLSQWKTELLPHIREQLTI